MGVYIQKWVCITKVGIFYSSILFWLHWCLRHCAYITGVTPHRKDFVNTTGLTSHSTRVWLHTERICFSKFLTISDYPFHTERIFTRRIRIFTRGVRIYLRSLRIYLRGVRIFLRSISQFSQQLWNSYLLAMHDHPMRIATVRPRMSRPDDARVRICWL